MKASNRGNTPSTGVSWLTAGTLLVLFLVAFVSLPAAADDDQLDLGATWLPGRAPDLALVVESLPGEFQPDVASPESSEASESSEVDGEDQLTTVVSELGEVDGIAGVVAQRLNTGDAVVYLTVSNRITAADLDRLESLVQDKLAPAKVTMLGVGAADARFESGVTREVTVAAILLLLIAASGVAFVFGWRLGLGISLTLGLAAFAGGILGRWMAGPFTGSIITTLLPGMVAGVVSASLMTYAILKKLMSLLRSSGAGRSRIVGGAAGIAVNVARVHVVVAVQLVAVAFIVGGIFPSTNPVLAVTVGAIVGGFVASIVVPKVFEISADGIFERPKRLLVWWKRRLAETPTRPLGLGLAALVILVMVVGINNTIGKAGAGRLDESRAGEWGSSSALVLDSVGDLTTAITVSVSAEADPNSVSDVAADLSTISDVKRVVTSAEQFADGSALDQTEDGQAIFSSLDSADRRTLFVVPETSSRSTATGEIHREVMDRVDLPGLSVDSRRLDEFRRQQLLGLSLLTTLLLIVVVGFFSAYFVSRQWRLAATCAALKMLVLNAAVGLSSLLMAAASVDEMLVIVMLLTVVLAWFEVGYNSSAVRVAPFLASVNLTDIGDGMSTIRPWVRSSTLGLGVLALVGAMSMYADVSYLRPLGLSVLVVALASAAILTVLQPAAERYLTSAERPTVSRRRLRDRLNRVRSVRRRSAIRPALDRQRSKRARGRGGSSSFENEGPEADPDEGQADESVEGEVGGSVETELEESVESVRGEVEESVETELEESVEVDLDESDESVEGEVGESVEVELDVTGGLVIDQPGDAQAALPFAHPDDADGPLTDSRVNIGIAKTLALEKELDPKGSPNSESEIAGKASDPEIRRLITEALAVRTDPEFAPIELTFFEGTDIYERIVRLRNHRLLTGQVVEGEMPSVLSIDIVREDLPLQVEVVAEYPELRLLDPADEVVETRHRITRRSTAWLAQSEDGFKVSDWHDTWTEAAT